ncbi:dienelactone hydrolase family protein [Diplocarpon rosae]|nr:dienelactone hydrolase family protein [Diplocarpon rosae]
MLTGPVARFARQIAGQGYIVAAPSSYHEFTGPEALAYDGPGTDAGNEWKVKKTLAGYDEDATLSIDLLLSLKTCNGRVGTTGMKDDSLARAGEIKAELAMIHGTLDNHVPAAGRDLIRTTLREKGVLFSWYEVAGAQHAFIRDELSKGRYDPAITKICFEILLELFGRTLKLDLGAHDGVEQEIEDIC